MNRSMTCPWIGPDFLAITCPDGFVQVVDADKAYYYYYYYY